MPAGDYHGFPVYREKRTPRGPHLDRHGEWRARSRRTGNIDRIIVGLHARSRHERRWVSIGRNTRTRCRASPPGRRHDRRTGRRSQRHRSCADASASLRLDPVKDGVYAVDGTPTDCVNVAITQSLRRASCRTSSCRVSTRDTTWATTSPTREPSPARWRERCSVFQALLVSLRATRGEYDFSFASRAAAVLADAMLRSPLPPRTFSERQRAERASRGATARPFRRSAITSPPSPSGRIRKGGRTSGSKKGRTSGNRTTSPTTRPFATATFRSHRCIPTSRRMRR